MIRGAAQENDERKLPVEKKQYGKESHQRQGLLQRIGQIGGESELDFFDVVGDSRYEISGGVPVKELGRLIDHILVGVGPQAGDAGLPHVVQDIGRTVFGHSLGERGQNSQQPHHQPGILKGEGIDLFQVDFLGENEQFSEGGRCLEDRERAGGPSPAPPARPGSP